MNKRTSIFFLVVVTLVFAISITQCSRGDNGGISINCGDNEAVYVRMDADDSNPGIMSEPLGTIQAAVACAIAGQDIRVANGTYETNSYDDKRIYLGGGISLYGGYSSDFQFRDANVYPTIITDTTDSSTSSSEKICAVMTNPDTTSSSVLDGFTINGAVLVTGAPTITNNIINGGGDVKESYGIDIESGSPTILNNTINAGNANEYTWGISSTAMGPVKISGNEIHGGDGLNSTAIRLKSLGASDSVISNNSIDGGYGYILATGINIDMNTDTGASVLIEANTIKGWGYNVGSGSLQGSGWGIVSHNGETIIRNNTIRAKTMGLSNASNSVISNNTIQAGNFLQAVGITTATSAAIVNNIISSGISDEFYNICIDEQDSDSDPVLLSNNDLIGCTTLYRDEGAVNITNIADVNALADINASGNISIPPNLDSSQDYRLTEASPVEVTQGGLDLSDNFSTDKAGDTRTVPWSMGAYEYD